MQEYSEQSQRLSRKENLDVTKWGLRVASEVSMETFKWD